MTVGVFVVVLLVIAVIVLALLAELRKLRLRNARHFADLDSLLLAQLRLIGVDERHACDITCAVIASLADSRRAVYYRGPRGHLLVGGQYGIDGAFPRPTPVEENAVSTAMEDGLVGRDPLVIPVPDGRRIMGVVVVFAPQRDLDDQTLATLALAGRQLGPILRQFHRPFSLDHDVIDPVTGVGSPAAASVLLADLRPGDALAIVGLALTGGSPALNAELARYLRHVIRPTDDVAMTADDQCLLLLRDVHAPADLVLHRLLLVWRQSHPEKALCAGGALHLPGLSPLETLDRSREALEVSRASGRDARAGDP